MAEPVLLYLARHGETRSNRERRFAGWNDDSLTPAGAAQARALAAWAADGEERPRRVYTSPVRRAAETAGLVSRRLGVPVHRIHELHELDVGVWQGLRAEQVESRWPERFRTWRERPLDVEVEGREPLDALQDRLLRAVDRVGRLEREEGRGPALVVGHQAPLLTVWVAAHGRPLSDIRSFHLANCDVLPVRWLGDGQLDPAAPEPIRVADGRAEPREG